MWISTILKAFRQRRLPRLLKAAAALLLLISMTSCTTPTVVLTGEIGIVTAAQGFPSVIRKNQKYILARESRIYANDIVNTDLNSKVRIRLVDQTRLTLGNSSHLVFHNYAQKPDTSWADIRAALTRGAVRTTRPIFGDGGEFVFTTPLATVTSTSQDFWVGYIFDERSLDVSILAGTHILVSNRDGTSQLNNPGYGINVISGAAPRSQRKWDDEKKTSAQQSTEI
jgi:hypothetical protein